MTRAILEPRRNTWVVEQATRAGLLVDARDYYRAFWEAAEQAQRSILIVGWQFDSGVALLRGDDVPRDAKRPSDVALLPFLDRLCKARPDLRVDILAWDFSVIYALERELLQKIIFDWTTQPNLRFRFDARCPVAGSHHQKFVVVDDALAFVGGTDLCEHRWDDRQHLAKNPFRADPDGTHYGPYHEVQAYVAGPVARRFTELFAMRWQAAGHDAIPEHTPADAPAPHLAHVPTRPSLLLEPGTVAISRTSPLCRPAADEAHEVRALFADGVQAAERLIFIETQYFTSRSIEHALVRRMRDTTRPPPEVVIVLPLHPEEMKEEFAIGIAQAKVLDRLTTEARRTGTPLGIFNVASRAEDGSDTFEYVHSKLMSVDDRFLTVGSANLTNRSMGLDTELHVSWETASPDGAVARRIRRARISLLAEHVGARGVAEVRPLVSPVGLVSRLNAIAAQGKQRLRPYVLGSTKRPPLFDYVDEDAIAYFDREEPDLLVEYEAHEPHVDGGLLGGLRRTLGDRLTQAWAALVHSQERTGRRG